VSIVYETMLGRLGSRMNLNFRPREKCIYTSPMGRFYDIPLELSLGIQIGEQVRILPFSSMYDSFAYVEQELTPTSVTFHCREPLLGVNATFRFIAPFYPQNEEVSGSPCFYIEAEVENTGVPKLVGDAALSQRSSKLTGELFLQLDGEQIQAVVPDSGGYRFAITMSIDEGLAKQKWLHKTRGQAFSSAEFQGELAAASLEIDRAQISGRRIHVPFCIETNERSLSSFLLAGYTNESVMQVEEGLYSFKYINRFASIQEVVEDARKQQDTILNLCEITDEALSAGCPDKSAVQLTSFALQSFLSNTWWMTHGDKEDWFTVWEGNCAYHSTVDVEYNTSMFYLMLWPELLAMTIRQWTRYVKQEGFMSHDIGKFLVGKGMEYGHDMEVEENCNFILLLFALYKYTGDSSLIDSHYELVRQLIEFVAACDTTGSGFPSKGTANTIDDAGAAVQYAKEQTYLGIKAYSAFTAVQELAKLVKDDRTYELCSNMRERISQTLDERAWLGDHYAVCIQASGENVQDVWTGEAVGEQIPGWDAYSIYPSNGLLYLMMTGTEFGLDRDRLRTDLRLATKHSMTRYGCVHSSKDLTGNLWISQNMWKDMIAAYLGVDMIGLSDRYWDYELYENAQGIGGCFVDAPPRAHLNYYPRGAVALGIPYALGGVQIDRVKRTLSFNPVRVPCRIPLLSFADWQSGIVPWVEFTLEQGWVKAQLENGNLLNGYELFLFGHKISV
jgi:hypothetical protein